MARTRAGVSGSRSTARRPCPVRPRPRSRPPPARCRAALARALEAERVVVHHALDRDGVDRRQLGERRHRVVGERDRQRVAVVVVGSSSKSAPAIPCAAPPASCPRTIAGFTARPTCCATCRSGVTRPVASSTARPKVPRRTRSSGAPCRSAPGPAEPDQRVELLLGVNGHRRQRLGGARASARAAIATAFPATTVLRLANEPKPLATSSVSWWCTTTRATSTPSSSAAIVASAVSMPWPSEPTPARTTTVPSGTPPRRLLERPDPPSSTIAATPTPMRSVATTRVPQRAACRGRLREQLLEGPGSRRSP